ncbi:MAG: hypothetical protein ACK5HP_02290 [Bacilli bacterium]
MKKIFILITLSLITLVIFIIYLIKQDTKIYYVDLNDYTLTDNSLNNQIVNYLKSINKLEKSINEFNLTDSRTTDLINMIKNNESIIVNKKQHTIKNVLIKADLLVLSIGYNDFIYKIKNSSNYELYTYIDQMAIHMEELFDLIRQYSKEDIIFIGYYAFENIEIYNYLDTKVENLCNKYNIYFINPNQILDNEDISDNYVNSLGNTKIYYTIQSIIKEKILK